MKEGCQTSGIPQDEPIELSVCVPALTPSEGENDPEGGSVVRRAATVTIGPGSPSPGNRALSFSSRHGKPKGRATFVTVTLVDQEHRASSQRFQTCLGP